MAKRPVFQDVGERQQPVTAAGGLIDRGTGGNRGPIRIWLAVLFLLVFAMILVGGLTRLTDSGLSITEWRPVTGALPPVSDAAWQAEFARYKAIPEYQLQNRGMSLADFKSLYWWEWSHRQLGRIIGLVWVIGFAWFLARRRIPPGWTGRLAAIGILGGLQGAIGWWMVSSGLSGAMLDVASYRLAIHLGIAFVILGLIVWFFLALTRGDVQLIQARRTGDQWLFRLATGALCWTFLQILLGALVAGIDAGRSFTDWPLMAGGFFPPDPFALTPRWRNFFEDPGLVQFIHRLSAYGLLVYGAFIWRASRSSGNRALRLAFSRMAAMLLVQAALGIVTVLYIAPVGLALLHQAGAVLLWVLTVNARFHARYPQTQSIRGT